MQSITAAACTPAQLPIPQHASVASHIDRCMSGAGDVLRMRVGGRNDHGPLNMGPRLQLSLEDAVDMQLQASRSYATSAACLCEALTRSPSPVRTPTLLEVAFSEAASSLQALQKNNEPHADHGIEVLYRYAFRPRRAPVEDCVKMRSKRRTHLLRRFTNFDPFERTQYFGRSLDLGQFERFRRIFHTPFYAVLLNHQGHETLGSLQVRADEMPCCPARCIATADVLCDQEDGLPTTPERYTINLQPIS